MRGTLVIGLLLFTTLANAQKNAVPTNEFTITGEVKTAIKFSVNLGAGFEIHTIDSVIIFSHLHERKRAIHSVKGILLKDVLEKAG